MTWPERVAPARHRQLAQEPLNTVVAKSLQIETPSDEGAGDTQSAGSGSARSGSFTVISPLDSGKKLLKQASTLGKQATTYRHNHTSVVVNHQVTRLPVRWRSRAGVEPDSGLQARHNGPAYHSGARSSRAATQVPVEATDIRRTCLEETAGVDAVKRPHRWHALPAGSCNLYTYPHVTVKVLDQAGKKEVERTYSPKAISSRRSRSVKALLIADLGMTEQRDEVGAAVMHAIVVANNAAALALALEAYAAKPSLLTAAPSRASRAGCPSSLASLPSTSSASTSGRICCATCSTLRELTWSATTRRCFTRPRRASSSRTSRCASTAARARVRLRLRPARRRRQDARDGPRDAQRRERAVQADGLPAAARGHGERPARDVPVDDQGAAVGGARRREDGDLRRPHEGHPTALDDAAAARGEARQQGDVQGHPAAAVPGAVGLGARHQVPRPPHRHRLRQPRRGRRDGARRHDRRQGVDADDAPRLVHGRLPPPALHRQVAAVGWKVHYVLRTVDVTIMVCLVVIGFSLKQGLAWAETLFNLDGRRHPDDLQRGQGELPRTNTTTSARSAQGPRQGAQDRLARDRQGHDRVDAAARRPNHGPLLPAHDGGLPDLHGRRRRGRDVAARRSGRSCPTTTT